MRQFRIATISNPNGIYFIIECKRLFRWKQYGTKTYLKHDDAKRALRQLTNPIDYSGEDH